jgi:hypothetical protein
MSKSSNAAKQRWNAKRYVQIKVSVNPETAKAFKAVCAAVGTSMASEIGAFMDEFAHPAQCAVPHTKMKTLGDRRRTMNTIISLLNGMRDTEKGSLDRWPINLQGTDNYEMAEERFDKLSDAIDAVEDIYE